MFESPGWNCPLEDVTEWQQAECEKNSLDCCKCMEQADSDTTEVE